MIFTEGCLCVVGTSHVAAQSVREVKQAFSAFKPDIIAVELDASRLETLFEKERGAPPLSAIKLVGLTGYLFVLIGGFLQRKIGSILRIEPGAEMKAAVLLAREHKKPLLLADQHIHSTLRSLSRRWPAREKWRMFFDLFRSPFMKRFKIDLSRVPEQELIVELLKIVKGRYPKLYEILVAERDRPLARVTAAVLAQNPDKKVLLVIGAGHVAGVREHLAKSPQ